MKESDEAHEAIMNLKDALLERISVMKKSNKAHKLIYAEADKAFKTIDESYSAMKALEDTLNQCNIDDAGNQFVQLVSGCIYIDTLSENRVVLKWINVHDDGEVWAIVHPEGELSMQDCYGIRTNKLANPRSKK